MNRGVSFQIPQKMTNTLWKMFGNISVKEYFWHIIKAQTEIWGEDKNADFFEKDFYDTEDFFDICYRDHFIVFLKMQLYSTTNTSFDNISDYKEFLNSDCRMIVLVYDCEYAEIYSKNTNVVDELFENALLT